MPSDAYFAIGRGHDVCEDYALADDDGRWVLLADGCSSSPRTDVGARLLVHAAAQSIGAAWLEPAGSVVRAARVVRSMGLGASSLDATLCWIRRDSAEAHAGLTGDGVIAAERRDGRIEAWAISDRDGAPGYLSYLLDDERKQHYLARHGERIVEHWLDGAVHCRWHERLNASPWQFVVRLCPADYALAMIMSDGVASLVDRSGAAVSLGLVLPQLFELKGGRGRFVTRRCKRFFGREAERSGWRHHDDVAVAALTLELS